MRAALLVRGRTRTQWEVGTSAPAGLVDALPTRGLTHDTDPHAVALVLTEEPPPVGAGLVAHRVETFAEHERANAVQWATFEMPVNELAEARALLPERWRETVNLMHAVWLDDELVCAATCQAPMGRRPGLCCLDGHRPTARHRHART